jgi:hypothetical protein
MSLSAQLTSEQVKEIIEDEKNTDKVHGRFRSKWRMVRRSSIQKIQAQY